MTHNTWADKSSLGVSPGQRSPPSGRSPGGTHLLQSRTPPPQGQAAWSAPLTWEGVPEAPSRALVTMLPCTGTAVSTRFLSPQAAHRSVHEPAHLPCGWRHAGRGGALRQLRHFASPAGARSVLATCTLNAATDTALQEVPSTRDSPDNA